VEEGGINVLIERVGSCGGDSKERFRTIAKKRKNKMVKEGDSASTVRRGEGEEGAVRGE